MDEQGAQCPTAQSGPQIITCLDRLVPSPVQASAILQEVESSTPGNKVQLVFERQADISPEALAELIEQARSAALGACILCTLLPFVSFWNELRHCEADREAILHPVQT